MTDVLREYKALSFDCYGTLIDWETGIWDAFQPLLVRNGRSDITRDKALETHAVFESKQQSQTPAMLYQEILAKVHADVAAHFKLQTTRQLDENFGNSLAHWPAFPDTADALRYLKTRYKLVILSNVSRDGFALSNRKLGVEFDAIYTAEDIASYKPALENFNYLLSRLHRDHGLEKRHILHTAQSLFHDHVPAKFLGIACAWIDRQRLSESGNWGATAKVRERPETDYLFFSMAELVAAVRGRTD